MGGKLGSIFTVFVFRTPNFFRSWRFVTAVFRCRDIWSESCIYVDQFLAGFLKKTKTIPMLKKTCQKLVDLGLLSDPISQQRNIKAVSDERSTPFDPPSSKHARQLRKFRIRKLPDRPAKKNLKSSV